VLVKFPALLLLFPHLWVTIARMIRAGYAGKAVTLFPWLVAGEIYRIRGFFEARRETQNAAGAANALTPALSRREREKETA
jgi:hypothetical protein